MISTLQSFGHIQRIFRRVSTWNSVYVDYTVRSQKSYIDPNGGRSWTIVDDHSFIIQGPTTPFSATFSTCPNPPSSSINQSRSYASILNPYANQPQVINSHANPNPCVPSSPSPTNKVIANTRSIKENGKPGLHFSKEDVVHGERRTSNFSVVLKFSSISP